MDDSQTAWTSLIGYLLGALYFFVMVGVPRSRGYTAKAMAWNRPQIAVTPSCGSLSGSRALSPAWSVLACCSGQSFQVAFDFGLLWVLVSMPSGSEDWHGELGCAVLDETLASMSGVRTYDCLHNC